MRHYSFGPKSLKEIVQACFFSQSKHCNMVQPSYSRCKVTSAPHRFSIIVLSKLLLEARLLDKIIRMDSPAYNTLAGIVIGTILIQERISSIHPTLSDPFSAAFRFTFVCFLACLFAIIID